jgi:hypothetical protein
MTVPRLVCVGKDCCRKLASGFRRALARTVYTNKKVPLTWKDRTCLGTYQPRAEGTFQVVRHEVAGVEWVSCLEDR